MLTSDRPPGELDALEPRLRERFACGLIAELEPPDLDVRLAILRTRARLDALHGVPDETLAEIARHVTSSVRALEGALIRVVAYALAARRDADARARRQRAPAALPARRPTRPPTLDEIQTATAEALGVTPDELLAHDRRPQVALARQVAMYLARELTDESLPAIGRELRRPQPLDRPARPPPHQGQPRRATPRPPAPSTVCAAASTPPLVTTGAAATIHRLCAGTESPPSRSGSEVSATPAHIHSPYFN